jgi:hypothetical protein
MESMLIAGWMTAKPALDELHTRREAKIIEEYSNMVEEQGEEMVQKSDV